MSAAQEAREEASDRLSEIHEEIANLIDEAAEIVMPFKSVAKQLAPYLVALKAAYDGQAGGYTISDAESELRED